MKSYRGVGRPTTTPLIVTVKSWNLGYIYIYIVCVYSSERNIGFDAVMKSYFGTNHYLWRDLYSMKTNPSGEIYYEITNLKREIPLSSLRSANFTTFPRCRTRFPRYLSNLLSRVKSVTRGGRMNGIRGFASRQAKRQHDAIHERAERDRGIVVERLVVSKKQKFIGRRPRWRVPNWIRSVQTESVPPMLVPHRYSPEHLVQRSTTSSKFNLHIHDNSFVPHGTT